MPFSHFSRAVNKYSTIQYDPLGAMKETTKRVYLSASLTVEAALVIPLITFFAILLASPLFIMNTELILHDRLINTTLKVSEYRYVTKKAETLSTKEENKELLTTAASSLSVSYAVGSIMDKDFKNHLDKSIVFDKSSFSFKHSSISADSPEIDIVTDYKVKIHLPIKIPTIHLVQRCYTRSFTGLSLLESDYEPVRVYITKYGNAYHKSKECPYLYNMDFVQLTPMQKVNYKDDICYLDTTYKSCHLCTMYFDSVKDDYIYLSIGAYHYHYSLKCPSLKRTVYSVDLEQAESEHHPCSLCY